MPAVQQHQVGATAQPAPDHVVPEDRLRDTLASRFQCRDLRKGGSPNIGIGAVSQAVSHRSPLTTTVISQSALMDCTWITFFHLAMSAR